VGTIGQPVRFGDFSKDELAGRWRQLPRLTLDALRVSWGASRRQILITLGLQGATGLTMILQLLAAQRALQKLLVVGEPDFAGTELIVPFALLIAAMIAMGAFTALAERSQRLLAELVAQHAMRQIVSVSGRVEMAAFEDPAFHDQLERARNSAMTRSVLMVTSLNSFTLNLLTSAGIAVALLVLEPLLLPLVLISGIPMLLATMANSRRAYEFEWSLTPQNRERNYLIQLLTSREAGKELRVFGANGFLQSRYDGLSAERLSRMHGYLRERLRLAMAGTIGTTVGMGIALAALAWMIAVGRIPVATALTAGAAMQQLSSRIFGMMSSLGALVESGMFVDDYNSFLRLLPAEEEDEKLATAPSRPSPKKRFAGLEIDNVSFSYPAIERSVLKDVSLRIDPGEVVALVGENGSGKTTLVKLICQLYEPTSGRVRWSGADGGEIDPEEIRSDITVVFQDFLQYHLTAAENIALGRVEREPSGEALRGAAEQAGAHDFVSQLPSGYETRLGRQFVEGHDLSVGQWQRMALARAFFRAGSFLVLDEPTASLDPRAEYDLFQQMRKLWSGRSVLLVSHRFSSVRSADRIYVLREGRLIEGGSHTELMAEGGHYADLFSLQAAAYLDGSDNGGDHVAHKYPTTVGVPRA
jgi:ATP-binding cassette subfamily B protein